MKRWVILQNIFHIPWIFPLGKVTNEIQNTFVAREMLLWTNFGLRPLLRDIFNRLHEYPFKTKTNEAWKTPTERNSSVLNWNTHFCKHSLYLIRERGVFNFPNAPLCSPNKPTTGYLKSRKYNKLDRVLIVPRVLKASDKRRRSDHFTKNGGKRNENRHLKKYRKGLGNPSKFQWTNQYLRGVWQVEFSILGD